MNLGILLFLVVKVFLLFDIFELYGFLVQIKVGGVLDIKLIDFDESKVLEQIFKEIFLDEENFFKEEKRFLREDGYFRIEDERD